MNTVSKQEQTVASLFDLSDRVAVVAGGAGYLGSEVCQGLKQHGAQVVVADFQATQAELLVERLNGLPCGPPSHARPLDAGQEESIRDLMARVRSDFGAWTFWSI